MGDPKVLATRLRQEREILQKLLALAGEQRDCLIAGQAERLSEILTQQTLLIQKLSKATARTAVALKAIDDAHPLDSDEDIVICRQLHADVAELAEQLQRQGRINWSLAKEAMRYTDFSLSLLAGRTEAPAYSPTGRRAAQAMPVLMNRTA